MPDSRSGGGLSRRASGCAARAALCLAVALPLGAQQGSLDPLFASHPFPAWLAAGDTAFVRWTLKTAPVRLSVHQRLIAQINVQVDGTDLVARRGPGKLLIFVQVEDSRGLPYQQHGLIELDRMESGLTRSNLIYTQSIFVLPGDYRIAVALYDTRTREHAARTLKLHVPPLKADPLRDAWRGLPPVELVPPAEPPDSWYLPGVTGRLHLPLTSPHSPRIDVLVNVTAGDRDAGSLTVQNRNLTVLLPALKEILAIGPGDADIHVTLLDLTRQRVVYQQDRGPLLDWPKVREALADSSPGKIDVKALQDRHHKAAYFVSEVSRRLESVPPSERRVLVVLSGSMEFGFGQDLQSIQPPAATGCRVFYLRFLTEPVVLTLMPEDMRRRRSQPAIAPPVPNHRAPVVDQLAATLKPIAPKLFDIRSPEQLRKALAALLAGIEAW